MGVVSNDLIQWGLNIVGHVTAALSNGVTLSLPQRKTLGIRGHDGNN